MDKKREGRETCRWIMGGSSSSSRQEGERRIVRLNHPQSQHKHTRAYKGGLWRGVTSRQGCVCSVGMSRSHCAALYKDSELTSLRAPSAPSLTLLKPHKHAHAIQCIDTQTRRILIACASSKQTRARTKSHPLSTSE